MTVFIGPSIVVPMQAEPISNPLKGLANALKAHGVSIVPLLYVEGGAKIGHFGTVQQFSCTVDEDFPELARKIADLGKVVRFLEMCVPRRGVICAQSHIFGDIWARYLAAYDCPTDQMFGRWDVLVEPIK